MPKKRIAAKRRTKVWEPSEAECLRTIVEASERYLCASSEMEREDTISEIGAAMFALLQQDGFQNGELDAITSEWVDSGAWTDELRVAAHRDLTWRIQEDLKRILAFEEKRRLKRPSG